MGKKRALIHSFKLEAVRQVVGVHNAAEEPSARGGKSAPPVRIARQSGTRSIVVARCSACGDVGARARKGMDLGPLAGV
jgi:hypothetical protein